MKRDNCRAKGSSHQRTFSRQCSNLLAPIDQSSFYWRVHKDNRGHRIRGGAMQRGSKCKTEVGGLCCSHHTLTGIWEVGCWEWIKQKSVNTKLYAGAHYFDNVHLIQVSPDVTTRLDDRIGRVKPRSMYLENGSVTLILSWH